MRKHDYIALAKAIKEEAHYYWYNTTEPFIHRDSFVEKLCDILKADNPSFSKEKFLEAVK